MKWYHVRFEALKTVDPSGGMVRVHFDCEVESASPVDAIYETVRRWAGTDGDVDTWVESEGAKVPCNWLFPYGTAKDSSFFGLWIEDHNAVLSQMVTELGEDRQMRHLGPAVASGLFEVQP